ncbi:hypothetical protein L9F63_012706 [Diploptera punctata]|uniref:Uncharacterized protein n=1 Tax=Diploptera punctata TaxID=6984 RepID=A0AAD8ABU1_DIPPU|nr:hypothetical protein L9F63_012706 [Diploptera punctata]
MYLDASDDFHCNKHTDKDSSINQINVSGNVEWNRNGGLYQHRNFENINKGFREVYFAQCENKSVQKNGTSYQTVKMCTCKTCVKLFNQFCEMTSLHGLRFVGDSHKHIVDRLFWLAAFILSIFTASYYISISYEKWNDTPVIVSIAAKATQMIEIPFPAVTICTMNEARKSKAEEIINSTSEENKVYKKMLLDYCNNTNYMFTGINKENLTENWDRLLNFMKMVRQPCHEMLLACYYSGEEKDCNAIFNPSLTDEGICCSFNKVKRDLLFRNPRDLSDLNVTFPMPVVDWTPESGYPVNTPPGTLPWRPRGAGSRLGLTLLLNAETEEYYCSTSASKGFKLLLHNPVETPKIADYGSLIAPSREYRIKIRPTITNSSRSLNYVKEAERQCVFSSQKYLKFYKTYTQKNCVLECEANYTLKVCNCVPYYLPKDINTTICGRNEEDCINSARKILEMMMVDESTIGKKEWPKPVCRCLPGCTEINYGSVMTYGALEPDFVANKGYLKEPFNSSTSKRNLALVHLFFTETQFLSYYKTELIGVSDFMATTGGLLGLFLGFSFISAVEVIYFLFVEVIGKLFKIRNNNTKHAAPNMENHKNTFPFVK